MYCCTRYRIMLHYTVLYIPLGSWAESLQYNLVTKGPLPRTCFVQQPIKPARQSQLASYILCLVAILLLLLLLLLLCLLLRGWSVHVLKGAGADHPQHRQQLRHRPMHGHVWLLQAASRPGVCVWCCCCCCWELC
jgi:hypothetical protein